MWGYFGLKIGDECLGLRACHNTYPNIYKPNLRLVNVTYCTMEQEIDPEFEINRTSTRVRVVGAVIKVELKPHFVVLPSCRCILELYESIKWMYRYTCSSSNIEKETSCSCTQKLTYLYSWSPEQGTLDAKETVVFWGNLQRIWDGRGSDLEVTWRGSGLHPSFVVLDVGHT